MQSNLVSSTVFLVVFAGALAGLRLRRVVPESAACSRGKECNQASDSLPVTIALRDADLGPLRVFGLPASR